MRSVDQRIVEMRINNQQFEKGAKESINTLDQLKKSLDLEGAEKNLKKLDKAGKEFSLEGMAKNIETISSRFTTLGIIGTKALQDIASSAVRTGKQMIDALTLQAPRMGFSEYETQINAIQTILANTQSKGTTLDEINAALDELNSYADLTIYNFTQMTESIGRFTATGLGLDVSTASIKGLSNLAAMADSTAEQLNTAMYQLSQGLSAGVIKLQDWNSLRNANLTNEAFRESLLETARVHGVAIDDMIAKYGSLEYTLQEGWLSSEIMMETLLKFTGDYSEAEWVAIGYTEEQAKAIAELGKTAFGAATDVKTFTQLIDTTKEALQSGWTQSWEIIVGDFEEAKELWSGISDVLGGIISESANSRNSMLQSWKDLGGRKAIIEGLSNVFKALMNVITPVKEAFREIFPPTTGRQLASISKNFRNFTKNLVLTSDQMDILKSVAKGFFSALKTVLNGVKSFVSALSPISKLIPVIAGAIGTLVVGIGNYISYAADAANVSEIFRDIINKISGAVGSAVSAIKSFANGFKTGFDASAFSSLGSAVSNVANQIMNLGTKAKSVFSDFGSRAVGAATESYGAFTKFGNALNNIKSSISSFGNKIKEKFSPVVQKIKDAFEGVTITDLIGVGSLAGISVGFVKLVNAIKKPISQLLKGFGDISEGISDTLESVRKVLSAWQTSIKADTLMTIAKAVLILTASLIGLSFVDPDKLGPGLMGISALFTEVTTALILLDKLNVEGSVKTAASVLGIAGAVAIMAASLASLKEFGNFEELATPLLAMAAIAAVLVRVVQLMGAVDSTGMIKTATTMLVFSASISILGSALLKMEGLDTAKIFGSLLTILGVLTELAAFVKVLDGTNLSGVASTLVGLSVSLMAVTGAVALLGSMDPEVLSQGMNAVATQLIAMAAAIKIIGSANLSGVAVSIVAMATSMLILVGAVALFGNMDFMTLATGLTTVIALMVAMAGVMQLMSGAQMGTTALSLIAMATALTLLAAPIAILGSLPWQALALGIGALVVAIAAIGGVSILLSPFAAGMIAVGAALALFGATVTAIGAGVSLLGAGLAMLATSAVAGASALLVAIPIIGEALEQLILTTLEVIRNTAPAIFETMAIVIQSLLETLVSYGPSIATSAWELFKQLITGLLMVAGDLLSALWGLLKMIGSALADFVSPMVEAGKNLVQGLINGILGLPGAIVDAAKSLGSSFLNGIKDFLGIHSPSTETYGVGTNVVKGLVNGVTAGYGSAESAGQGLGQATQNGAKKSLAELLSEFADTGKKAGTSGSSAGKNFSSGVAEGIKKEKSPEEAAEEKAKEIKERFEKELKGTELDTEKVALEFEIWEAQTEKTVKAQEYYVKKKEYINKKIEYQTQVTAKAEEKYQEMVKTFGESSEYAKEAYNEWLKEQKELTELGNGLADLTQETVDKINSAYDEMNKTLENRANRLDLQGQLADSMSFKDVEIKPVSVDVLAKNVTKAEGEYRKAVLMFGKDSDQAVAAYEKLEIARRNYSRNQGGVFDAELEYKRAIKEYGEDSEEAIEALEAYEQAKTDAARRKDYSSDLDDQLSALEEAETYYRSIAKEFGEDSEEASYAQLLIEQAQADLDSAQNALNANNRRKAYSNFTSFLRGVGKYGPQAEKAANALAKYKELLNVPGVDQATLDEAYNDYLQEQVNLLGIVDNFAEEAGLGEGAHAALNILAKSLGENWPLVTDKWGELVEELGPMLEEYNIDDSVIDFVKKIFENPSLETILSEGLSMLIKSVLSDDKLFGTLKNILKGLPDVIAKFLPNIGTIFSGESSGIIDTVTKILPNIGTALSGGLGGVFKGITGFLGSIFPKLGTLLSGGFGGLLTSIGGGLSGLIGSLGSTLSGVVGTIGTGLAALASSFGPVGIAIAAVVAALVGLLATSKDFRNFVVGAFKSIGSVLSGVFNTLKNIVVNVFNVIFNVVEGIVNAITGFIDLVKGLFKGVTDFFSNFSLPNIFGGGSSSNSKSASSEGNSIGGSLIGGIIQGITSPIGTIVKGIKVVGGAVVNGFKNFFGIHSPSRVFAELGGQLINGLVVGIDDGVPKAKKSIDTFGSAIDAQMANLISNIDNIAEPTIRPVLDTSSVTDGVKNLSGLFSKNSSVKLSGNVDVARTAMYSADKARENQNGEASLGSTPTSGSTYSFVQNNYSPKALSKSEIYRQTKNQFSMLKGRA